MAVSGSHKEMGNWHGQPLLMGLGNSRTLLTGVEGRCWEATFGAEDKDVENVKYRYVETCVVAVCASCWDASRRC